MVNASRGSLLRFRYQLIGPLVLGPAAACPVIPRAQAAPVWTATDKWGSYSDGGDKVSNAVWGDGAGPQTIWANSYRNWGVQADRPAGGGVRSYPNVSKDVGKKLGELNKLTSSYGVKVPSGGVYNTAYDIWADSTKADVGGDSWTVHRGTNGSTKATISFVRDSNSTSGTVDILAILKYAQQQGWFGDVTVTGARSVGRSSPRPVGWNSRSPTSTSTTRKVRNCSSTWVPLPDRDVRRRIADEGPY